MMCRIHLEEIIQLHEVYFYLFWGVKTKTQKFKMKFFGENMGLSGNVIHDETLR